MSCSGLCCTIIIHTIILNSDFEPPRPEMKKTSTPHGAEILSSIKEDIKLICQDIQQMYKIDRHTKLPAALYHQLHNTFTCCICHNAPIVPKVIFARCCKSIVGCQNCTDQWYREDGMNKPSLVPSVHGRQKECLVSAICASVKLTVFIPLLFCIMMQPYLLFSINTTLRSIMEEMVKKKLSHSHFSMAYSHCIIRLGRLCVRPRLMRFRCHCHCKCPLHGRIPK